MNKYQNFHKKSEQGFTLIELVVVIVLVGILAALALPIFLNQQKASLRSGMKSDVRSLASSVKTYLQTNPVANNLSWRWDHGVISGALATERRWDKKISPSDPNTILIIRKTQSTTPLNGTWEEYMILAASIPASNNGSYYYYRYSSDTDEYSEVNP